MQSSIYAEHFHQRDTNQQIASISQEFKNDIEDEILAVYEEFEVNLEESIQTLKKGMNEARKMLKATNTTHDKLVDLYVDEEVKVYIERAKERMQGLLQKARMITMR